MEDATVPPAQQVPPTQPHAQADPFPAVQLQCAEALTSTTLTPEEEMERAKAVMQSSPRMPAVGFFGGRYGEKWHVDLVCLTHNAVRRQLYDAFTIANALGKLSLDVAEADLTLVYTWLGTLHHFVSAVFVAEDRFLYPLVDANMKKAKTSDGTPVYLPELLSVRGRKNAKDMVMDLLSTARKTRDVATGETPAKINALRYALDQFGANILDYFAAMERFVPKLFKKALRNGPKEKEKVEKKLFDYLLSESHGAMLAALLLQCIESRAKRAEFVARNIRREKDRVSFKSHVKKVEATHMQLARAFDSVSSRYERRFSVNTFLEHYDANTDGQMTLAMLGDLDINAEGEGSSAPPVGQYEAGTALVPVEEKGDALDDDVIEVLAEVDSQTS